MTDFDHLSNLYKTNPDLFHQECEKIKEEFLQSLPEEKQQRYRALQWKIDQELSHFKDPIARMNKMVEMFWDGFSKFQSSLQQLTTPIEKSTDHCKNIIPFNKTKS